MPCYWDLESSLLGHAGNFRVRVNKVGKEREGLGVCIQRIRPAGKEKQAYGILGRPDLR